MYKYSRQIFRRLQSYLLDCLVGCLYNMPRLSSVCRDAMEACSRKSFRWISQRSRKWPWLLYTLACVILTLLAFVEKYCFQQGFPISIRRWILDAENAQGPDWKG